MNVDPGYLILIGLLVGPGQVILLALLSFGPVILALLAIYTMLAWEVFALLYGSLWAAILIYAAWFRLLAWCAGPHEADEADIFAPPRHDPEAWYDSGRDDYPRIPLGAIEGDGLLEDGGAS